jgi:hypothetical protein
MAMKINVFKGEKNDAGLFFKALTTQVLSGFSTAVNKVPALTLEQMLPAHKTVAYPAGAPRSRAFLKSASHHS